MALPARAISLKSISLPVTVRALPSGVPYAPNINFYAQSHGISGYGNPLPQYDDHAAHGHGPSARAEVPKFAGGIRLTGSKFESQTQINAVVSRNLHTSSSAPVASTEPYTTVPDFSHYQASSPSGNRAMSYFMVGSLGLLSAVAAKATITDFLSSMAASADVLALARVEVAMANIPEGKNVVIKWRGKPVFIRHRTEDEIKEARAVDIKTLRDPQTDEERTKRPEWLVMVGVCTHLGCVPIGESGDYGGWFCPCHGSHYDISGRARKGPAPLNLEVPEYDFNDAEEKLVIG